MPVVGVSGLTGEGVDRLMEAVVDIHEVWNKRVSTNQLNKWLEEVTAAHPPPAVSGRRIRLNYVTQAKARPPTFVLFCARAEKVPPAYQRYLVNALRESLRPARHADPADACARRKIRSPARSASANERRAARLTS